MHVFHALLQSVCIFISIIRISVGSDPKRQFANWEAIPGWVSLTVSLLPSVFSISSSVATVIRPMRESQRLDHEWKEAREELHSQEIGGGW